MNALKRKLNSDSGASMMLALAMLLICFMVSSVIVSAAVSGSSRMETRNAKQQDYLAVSSAAQYIAKNLNPDGMGQFAGVYYSDMKPCMKYRNYAVTPNVELEGQLVDAYKIPMPKEVVAELANNTELDFESFYLLKGTQMSEEIFCEPSPWVEVDMTNTEFHGPFAELMIQAASQVYLQNTIYEHTFMLQIEDERIKDVTCEFVMDTNYNVSVTIHSTSGTSDYTMTVSMRMKSNELGETIVKEVSCSNEHTYFYQYWGDVGNIQTSSAATCKFTHLVNNPTTIITWGIPEITKGGY